VYRASCLLVRVDGHEKGHVEGKSLHCRYTKKTGTRLWTRVAALLQAIPSRPRFIS